MSPARLAKSLLAVLAVALLCALGSAINLDFAPQLGDCDPIAHKCRLPYPNNFYLEPASASWSHTGFKLRLRESMMPADQRGDKFVPAPWATLDGFSPMPQIITYLGDVSLEGVVGHRDIEQSLSPGAKVVLLDADTGEVVPSWAEIDQSNAANEPLQERGFLIWAAGALKHERRYIVAIRDVLSASTRRPLPPTAGFRALRDKLPSEDSDIELRREHFERDVFGPLARAGIRRENLQQAWDFTVASQHSLTGRARHMRDDALSRIPASGIDYTIVSVHDNPAENIAREIVGRMRIPNYLDEPKPGASLVIDPDTDLPVFQQFVDVKFTMRIPTILAEEQRAGAILQYGHGLFGSQGQIGGSWLARIANTYGYVLLAVDWQGMASPDVPAVTRMLATDIGQFNILPDRLSQGITNAVLSMRMAMTSLSNDEVVKYGGVSVLKTNKLYYYGNSQGGILGNNYMALSPWVHRGCLDVPGAPYSMMLLRSVDFDPYYAILTSRYPKSIDVTWLLTLMGQAWDRAEPAGYVNSLSGEIPTLMPPGATAPAKRMLYHYSLGDAQVSWLSAQANNRAVGGRVFRGHMPEYNETVFGDLIPGTSTNEYSVAVGYDYGVPPAPEENIPPPKEYDTHSYTRKDPVVNQQMADFFATGFIHDVCGSDSSGCRRPIPTSVQPLPQLSATYDRHGGGRAVGRLVVDEGDY